jgi:excisionase family DNA binding protein
MEKIKEKSVLLSQVIQLVNQANQLLIAVTEYTGETAAVMVQEQKPAELNRTFEPKEIVTTKEASEILGRSKPALYALVHRGEISRHGSGRFAYFKRADLITISKPPALLEDSKSLTFTGV